MISLRPLIFCVLICISLIPILGLSAWTNKTFQEQVYASASEKSQLLVNNMTAALNRYIDDLTYAIKTAVSSNNTNENQHLADNLLQQLNVHTLGKYNNKGRRINTYFGDTIFTPNSLFSLKIDRQSLETNRVYFSDLIQNFLPEPSLFIYIKDNNNQFWLGALNREYLKEVQSLNNFGKGGHATIVDKKGRILAHPNQMWETTGKNISKQSLVKQVMAGEQGTSEFYSPDQKESLIASYNAIQQTGWGIMVTQPLKELDAGMNSIQNVTFVIASLSFILSIFISWWLSGMINIPLHNLTRKVNRIAGAFDNRPPHISSKLPVTKELYKLNQSLTNMTKQIEKDKMQLSDKIDAKILEIKEIEEKSQNLANIDYVTGLASRLFAFNKLDELTERRADFALLFINLDNFKPINDQYGHITGDRLLQAVAKRMSSQKTDTDKLIARYGGDEFLIIVNRVSDLDSLMDEVNEMLDLLTTPYIIDGLELHIGACIGIARNSLSQSSSADQLINQADQAMSLAKTKGKNKVILYSPLLNNQLKLASNQVHS